MSLIQMLITVFLVHGLSLVSPGPDLFLILRNSIGGSKTLGRLTATGIVLGNIFYVSCGLLISFAVEKQIGDKGLLVVKILGGFYMGYLGFKILREKLRKKESTVVSLEVSGAEGAVSWSGRKAIMTGFASTAFNGKAAAYFLSVVPQFINASNTSTVNTIIFVEFIALSSLWFFGISQISSHPKIKNFLEKRFALINSAVGIIFTLFAALLLYDAWKTL